MGLRSEQFFFRVSFNFSSSSFAFISILLKEDQRLPRSFNEAPIEKNPLRRTARPSDIVYVLLYCPDLEAFHLSLPTYRSKGRVEILLSDRWTGHEVHLWGFVQDSKGRASDSYYLGSGVLEEEFEDEWNAEGDDLLEEEPDTPVGEVDMSDEGGESEPTTSSVHRRRARDGDGHEVGT